MAIADYNSKDLLAINRFINTDQTIIEGILNSCTITLAFDENAVTSYEGNCGLELTVRLLSRFYPKINIIDLSNKNEKRKQELMDLAKTINHKIEFVSNNIDERIYLIAGSTTHVPQTDAKVIYFGSDNWIAKFSTKSVQEFCSSENPFGSGFAACLAVSNIFRILFKKINKTFETDEDVQISVFDLEQSNNAINPVMNEIFFSDITIVGIGAIGNGTIWALSKLNHLKGTLHLVDAQKIELSNLQRYILFGESDKSKIKVNRASKFFRQNGLKVITTVGKWEEYIHKRNDWNIGCVAIGIDNAIDRIRIQSSLPQTVFNAFTEPELIGISRHKDFTQEACLACSYITLDKKKDYLHEICDNCNIPDKYEMVKDYYNIKLPVDEKWEPRYPESLLATIAKANGIEHSNLYQFKGKKVEEFYSGFICSGIILKLSQPNTKIVNVDAPLAFQSVMAGILLAAELVKYSVEPNLIQMQRTDFNHLAPLKLGINPYHRPLEKDQTMHCFCRDEDFVTRYKKKWNS